MSELRDQLVQMQLPQRIHRQQLPAPLISALSLRYDLAMPGCYHRLYQSSSSVQTLTVVEEVCFNLTFVTWTPTEACGPDATCVNRPSGLGYDCRCHLGKFGSKCMDGETGSYFNVLLRGFPFPVPLHNQPEELSCRDHVIPLSSSLQVTVTVANISCVVSSWNVAGCNYRYSLRVMKYPELEFM